MEQYIRITKCDRSSYWYSELIGKTYPVVRVTSRGDYEVARNEAEGFAFSIFKSDCELVSITVNSKIGTEQEPSGKPIESSLEEAAKAHGNYTSFEHGERFQTAYNSFKSGAIWQKWQKEQSIGTEQDLLAAGDIKKRWLQEKEGYTITDRQIDTLVDLASTGYHGSIPVRLKEWFPNAECFKPKEPSYVPGTRFISGDDELILVRDKGTWRLANCNTGIILDGSCLSHPDAETLDLFQVQCIAGFRDIKEV